MNEKKKTIISLVGPTACGKTSLGIQLAKEFSCEIISADSRQFYKEMCIGTARPQPSEMDGVPHHFSGFISVTENYNAGIFETDVLNFLTTYFTRNNMAILVGGSGLYVNAVLEGFDHIPPSDVSVRNAILAEMKKSGMEFMLEKLKSLDREYYETVDRKNPHRIVRALEVCIVSGLPYSSFRKKQQKESGGEGKKNMGRDFNIIKTGISYPRTVLNERINTRVDEMINNGLVNEVEKLIPYKNLNALKTLGYEELFDYFEKENRQPADLLKAIELIKQNTRKFAKRQMTWFKKDADIAWFDPEDSDKIKSFIKGNLN